MIIGDSQLIRGNMLEELAKIPDQSIDCIIDDLPYGTTQCSWDVIIPLDQMWEQFKRVIKPRGAILLFATEPFTSILTVSNLEMFKYRWTWVKNRATGFMQAKVAPLRVTEDVCIFSHATINGNHLKSGKSMNYYPQGLIPINKEYMYDGREIYGGDIRPRMVKQTQTNYPKNVLEDFPIEIGLHPTQKPVTLLEYLILTYSLEGDIILDGTAGSFSTGVAAQNTGRKFIGIELDERYYNIGVDRMRANYERIYRV